LEIFTKAGIVSSFTIGSLIVPHVSTASLPRTCLDGIPMLLRTSLCNHAFQSFLCLFTPTSTNTYQWIIISYGRSLLRNVLFGMVDNSSQNVDKAQFSEGAKKFWLIYDLCVKET